MVRIFKKGPKKDSTLLGEDPEATTKVRLGLLNQSSLVCRTGLSSYHFFPPLALSKQTMVPAIRSLRYLLLFHQS